MRKDQIILNLWPIPMAALGLILFNIIIYTNREPQKATYIALILPWIGFISFFIAKWSVLKTGQKITFGSSQMSLGYKFLYWAGYLVMLLGVLFGFVLIKMANSAV